MRLRRMCLKLRGNSIKMQVDMTYKMKLILSIAAIQIVALIMLSFGGMQIANGLATDALHVKANDVSKFLQPVGIVAIQKEDTRLFERMAKLVLLSEDIDLVGLVDNSGTVLIDEKDTAAGASEGFVFRKNLNKDNHVFGQVRINLSQEVEAAAYDDAEWYMIKFIIAIQLLLLIIGGAVGYFLLTKHDAEFEPEVDESEVVFNEEVSEYERDVKQMHIEQMNNGQFEPENNQTEFTPTLMQSSIEEIKQKAEKYQAAQGSQNSPITQVTSSPIESEEPLPLEGTEEELEGNDSLSDETIPFETIPPESPEIELEQTESVENESLSFETVDTESMALESLPLDQSPKVETPAETGNLEMVALEAETTEKTTDIFPEIINKSFDAVILMDFSGVIVECNAAAESLFSFNRKNVLGKNAKDHLNFDQSGAWYSNFLSLLNSEKETISEELFESKIHGDEDRVIDINVHLAVISSENRIVLYASDVSQHKATENRLNYLSFNDELTDLPNLSLLSDYIRKAVFDADENNRQIVVLKLGLDRFKHINESLGHHFGDYLIRNVAARLKNAIRRGDMVSRINGDQFVIALVDVSNESNVDVLVQKYLDCFIEAFQIENHKIHVNVSIGATLYPQDEKTVDGLLRNAESAMFRAKDNGGNNYQFFSQEMRENSQERLYMENELRKALGLDEFEIHYQPQVNLNTGKIIGVEALIRWNHPDMGLVPPLKFIPLAEEIGLIIPIGEWVLKNACSHNKKLMEERNESLILAVNLSARQFKNNDLVESIASILHETEYPPELLELEITESMLMENMDDVADTLRVLSDQGIRISMDDFGTGYSSLSYLKSFPINTLKVDRSFIHDLEDDGDNASIVTATIQMAHSLNIDIVAEGVETEGQLEFLVNKKCDKIQGYYFSRPLESDALRELLNKNQKIKLDGSGLRLISNS